MKRLLEFAKFKNIATTTDPEIQKLLDVDFEFATLISEVYIKDWKKNIKVKWYNWVSVPEEDKPTHLFMRKIIDRTSFYSIPDFNNVIEYGLNEVFPYEIDKTITDSGSYALHFNNHRFYLIMQVNYDNLLSDNAEIYMVTLVNFFNTHKNIIEIYGD